MTNSLFGWEGTKTSIQLSFSVTTLLPYNVGQLQWANLLGGILLFLSAICFTLLLSSLAKAMYRLWHWRYFCSAAVSRVYRDAPDNSATGCRHCFLAQELTWQFLLYAMTNFDFLHLGSVLLEYGCDAYAGVGEDTVIYYVYDRGIRPEENPVKTKAGKMSRIMLQKHI